MFQCVPNILPWPDYVFHLGSKSNDIGLKLDFPNLIFNSLVQQSR